MIVVAPEPLADGLETTSALSQDTRADAMLLYIDALWSHETIQRPVASPARYEPRAEEEVARPKS